jgi:hypothetical protein
MANFMDKIKKKKTRFWGLERTSLCQKVHRLCPFVLVIAAGE